MLCQALGQDELEWALPTAPAPTRELRCEPGIGMELRQRQGREVGPSTSDCLGLTDSGLKQDQLQGLTGVPNACILSTLGRNWTRLRLLVKDSNL